MIKYLLILAVLILVGAGVWYYIFKPQQSNSLQAPKSQPKVIKIGILSQKMNKTYEASVASMKAELLRLGYNPQYLQEDIKDNSAFPAVAKHYVEADVDVIVTNSTPATKAALKATTTIPIVFGSVGDPVANGVAQSLDSSGNNATGVSSLSVDLTPKRLDFLKNINPVLSKVYFIHQPGEVSAENSKTKVLVEATVLKITLVEKDATTAAEVKALAPNLKASEAQAIMMSASAAIWSGVADLIEAQNREKIPLIGVERGMAERGAVMSYGPDYTIMGQQLAALVDQVLKGAKPQYLAIQRPKKVELIVNKKVADTLGIVISDSILSKADEVLK